MNMNIIFHKIWDVMKIQPVEPMTISPRTDNRPNQQNILKIAKSHIIKLVDIRFEYTCIFTRFLHTRYLFKH